jgi:hypothetical protein
LRTLVIVVLAGTLAGGCGKDPTSGDMSGGDVDMTVPECDPNGEACTDGTTCCSGECDPATSQCSGGGGCGAVGTDCTVPTDCCTLSCVANKCAATQCKSVGDGCTLGTECCSSKCNGTTCESLTPGGCFTLGNNCTADTECCSMLCGGTRCVSQGGPTACIATGDICFKSSDCCGANCVIAAGGTAGTCQDLPSTGTGNCKVAGEPCTSASNCCSRVCAASATGGSVCQIATGCRVKGELCTKDQDCCGGAGTGLPVETGAGLVTCNIAMGYTVGNCSAPSGGGTCVPYGGACGGSGATPAPQNCCNCASPKAQCCKPDSNSVYRCHGTPAVGDCPTGYTGVAPCCIAEGMQCTFSSECCNGNPCIPDASGVLKCTGMSCIPAGGVCTSSSDCCMGITCIIQPGASSGMCGTMPVSMCSLAGQDCSTTSPCCMGLTCAGPYPPGGACTAGQAGCTCVSVIP